MKPIRTTVIAAACAALLGAGAGCSQDGDDSSSEENGSQDEGAEEGEEGGDDAEKFDLASMEGTWSQLIPDTDSGAVDWNIDAEGNVERITAAFGEDQEPKLGAEGEVHELRDGNLVIVMKDAETSQEDYLLLEPTDDPDLWNDVDSEATFERDE